MRGEERGDPPSPACPPPVTAPAPPAATSPAPGAVRAGSAAALPPVLGVPACFTGAGALGAVHGACS